MGVKKATWRRQQGSLITLCSFCYRYIVVHSIQPSHLWALSTGKSVVCVCTGCHCSNSFLCTAGPADDGQCVMGRFCSPSQGKEELCWFWRLSWMFLFLPCLLCCCSTPNQASFQVKNTSLFFVYGKYN